MTGVVLLVLLIGAWIVLPALFLVALAVSVIADLLRNKIAVDALPFETTQSSSL